MNSPTLFDTPVASGLRNAESAVIRLEDVSVRYRAPEERLRTFKEYAIRRLQRRVRFKDFYALSHIDLEVYPGEILGIIGRNGAGKSTMLKVISRVLVPTQGRVYLRGRISPLLELAAGFHPELTGRENVMLNGTLLGHSIQEIDDRFDGIVSFSELGDFMEAPVRTYSSGMASRLGFAVATAWLPEILLVDEVLSVGDEAFRHKCQARMLEFRESGTTVVMVSHDLIAVGELCGRVAWLERGRIRMMGSAADVIAAYKTT
jgi:ABC-type polysaccharide/polyol phosphate transport system ATPase subunit